MNRAGCLKQFSLKYMPNLTNLEILNLFTAPKGTNDRFESPWIDGPFAYACNGYSMVRIPSDGLDLPLRHKEVPATILNIFEDLPRQDAFYEPVVMPQGLTKCPKCWGSGSYSVTDCDNCETTGSFARDGHDYHCQSCDGEGHTMGGDKKISCTTCSGYGVKFGLADLGGSEFNVQYLAKVQKLPNVEITINPDDNKASFFRFDGGIGFICSRRKD